MKKLFATTAIALTLGAAAPAMAQQFDGATLQYSHYSFDGGDWYSRAILGQAEVSFGRFSVQGDLGAFGWDGDSLTEYTHYGLHLFTDVSDMVTLGGFYTRTDWGGGDWEKGVGLEALVTSGPVIGEAYFGTGENDNGQGWDILGLDVEYGFGPVGPASNVAAFGAFRKVDYEIGSDYTTLEVGARAKMGSGAFASLGYNRVMREGGNDFEGVIFRIGYDIGKGATFGARDYLTTINGY